MIVHHITDIVQNGAIGLCAYYLWRTRRRQSELEDAMRLMRDVCLSAVEFVARARGMPSITCKRCGHTTYDTANKYCPQCKDTAQTEEHH